MSMKIFWPVLIAVFLAMRFGFSELADNRTVVTFCFGPSKCSIWSGAELVRRTFVTSKDGTHVLVQMSGFTFTGRNNQREFSGDNSEEVLSACEIYNAENWTCHKATNTAVDWNISLRNGKLINPGFFITGPSVWGSEFDLYRWYGSFALPRAPGKGDV